jgi:molybdenum-pterin binding domain
MKTSARNYFEGVIASIKSGSVNDEVMLDIGNGATITAIITKESTENLALKKQDKAFALIKSSSVILATDMEDIKLSTRNIMSGTVKRVTPGAVNSEVIIELSSGAMITAIVTNESCKNMNLKAGGKASAIFKASQVILGVKS